MIAALAMAAAVMFTDNAAYTVPVGVGIEPCRSWTANKHKHVGRILDEQWLFGFLTGADSIAAKSDEQKLVWPSDDGRDFVSFIDRYCTAHPSDTINQAARVLTRKLAREGGL